MKKFIVKEILKKEDPENEGFGYYYPSDESGNDWYEFLKTFRNDTQKVLYDPNTLQVISVEMDASLLAPTQVGWVVQEVTPTPIVSRMNLYFLDGKLVSLSKYEKIQDNKVVFNRELKIEDIKKDIQKLKEAKINKGILINHGEKKELFQPLRQSDVDAMELYKDSLPKDWKFYDSYNEPAKGTLSIEIYNYIITTRSKVLDALQMAEVDLLEKLKTLDDEEVRTFKVEEEYIKEYFNHGGVY